jgi:hypothetical protein
MKMKTLKIVLINLLLLFVSCREDMIEDEIATNTELKSSKVTLGPYTSPLPYNLNVVYFIPSDVTARPEYERRLSEILLHAQDYYRTNMYNWGYGNRTFGLLKDPATNRIKINVVKGSGTMASYNSISTTTQIHSEVMAYFASHPSDKTSNHTLIFIATPSISTPIPYNGFYYGVSRGAIVGDNEAFDMQYFNEKSSRGNQVIASMGGFLHELGHGFNLRHDALPKTQESVPGYGTSLMGLGNSTYGHSSTILTKASCALLATCEVFATAPQSSNFFYTGNYNFEVTSINHSVSNGVIHIWGTYNTNGPIISLNSYYNPSHSYFAVSGTDAPNASKTFHSYVTINDLHLQDRPYDFTIAAEFTDGTIKWATFPFTIKNGVPDLNFPVSTAGWAVSSSSQYGAHPASLAIDGDINTYWHTNYAAGSVQTAPIPGQPQQFPYYFDIDMASAKWILGASFIQHQGLTRTAKRIQIHTRPNTSSGWEYQGSYDLTNTTSKQYAQFGAYKYARYIRIVFYSSYDGQPYVAVPEIGIYQ